MAKSYQERRAVTARRALDVLPEERRPAVSVRGARPKACGGCTACCTSMRIEALDKPSWVRCQHECAGGCAVYRDKPAECDHYLCGYVQGVLVGGDEMRPDRLGLIVDFRPSIDEEGNELGDGETLICLREVAPLAATSDRGWSLVLKLATLGWNLIVVPYMAPETDGGQRLHHFRLQTSPRSKAPPGLFDGPPVDFRAYVREQSLRVLRGEQAAG